MKIIGTFLSTNRTCSWDSVEAAAEATIHSASRVQWCILTGRSWRGWVFDEVAE